MRRPTTAARTDGRHRGRLRTVLAGAVLASALGLTGALGAASLSGPAAGHGHGHGVHTDIQSWS